MRRTEAILPFLKLAASDPRGLLKLLMNYTKETHRKRYFQKTYGIPGLPFVDIAELVRIDETVDNYTYLDGTSRTIELAFLMALCRECTECAYLKIGSFRGESLYNVSKIADRCTSISLSRNEILATGGSTEFADQQRLFSGDLANVEHIEANSQNFDFSLLPSAYDVIFIDGDHSYEAVKSDTQNAFQLLKNEDSVIIWHDCGTGFGNYRYEVIAGVMDGAPPRKRDRIYRVSHTMCGIYTEKEVTPEFLDSPHRPTKTFSVTVKIRKGSPGLC